MIKNFKFGMLLIAVFAIVSVSCSEDEPEVILTPAQESGIIGSWLSQGSNIAPLLAAFDKIDADFNTDGTYETVARDTSGSDIVFTGTYAVVESDSVNIYDITINQTAPSSATSIGIFSVSGTTLTYEIAQTTPSIPGVTPPTASAGFGSTSSGGFGNTNIQKFIKQ